MNARTFPCVNTGKKMNGRTGAKTKKCAVHEAHSGQVVRHQPACCQQLSAFEECGTCLVFSSCAFRPVLLDVEMEFLRLSVADHWPLRGFRPFEFAYQSCFADFHQKIQHSHLLIVFRCSDCIFKLHFFMFWMRWLPSVRFCFSIFFACQIRFLFSISILQAFGLLGREMLYEID